MKRLDNRVGDDLPFQVDDVMIKVRAIETERVVKSSKDEVTVPALGDIGVHLNARRRPLEDSVVARRGLSA